MNGWKASLLLGLALAFVSSAADAGQQKKRTVISKTYMVDKKYKSMMGPQSTQQVHLGDPRRPELVWVTGYEARMVGKDGRTEKAQDFMCHSNLDIDPMAHRDVLEAEPTISGRLFTLSQGQLTIQFPDGFGIPVSTSEPLSLTTQVLNLNEEDTHHVRHKVTLRYVRDAEAGAPMKPLFQKSVYGLKLLEGEDGHYGAASSEEKHGPGCLAGANASDHTYEDQHGRKFTGHWVVEPGKEVNRTPVSKLLQLPYDTTVHYIAVHLHPFAESLELVDVTEKKSIFKSKVRATEGRIGIARVDYFSSEEGVLIHADHEYELISVYNNTTKEPQDSMAVMYMYFLDKVFHRDSVKIQASR